ncbi:bacteriocin [Sphingobacterium sp. SRCM116780]|uniref:bacteriocin n=1 Tax=Sphingobacterium sp. SRCM116780 TaxID=2907623 RepID=UPI001F45DC47|nr:bacteriocin [Sphingobacterium sp. SRCM116780]UIR56370.1 bacteriocin [Sphingobacterium sp. SRCM116780]
MKNLDLNKLGVQELNTKEMQNIEGGTFGTIGQIFKVVGNFFSNLGGILGGVFNI